MSHIIISSRPFLCYCLCLAFSLVAIRNELLLVLRTELFFILPLLLRSFFCLPIVSNSFESLTVWNHNRSFHNLLREGIEPNPGPSWAVVVEGVVTVVEKNGVGDEGLVRVKRALEDIGNRMSSEIVGRRLDDLDKEELFVNLPEDHRKVLVLAREQTTKLRRQLAGTVITFRLIFLSF